MLRGSDAGQLKTSVLSVSPGTGLLLLRRRLLLFLKKLMFLEAETSGFTGVPFYSDSGDWEKD